MQIASISGVLYPLALLACPVGMGAMMWMMTKGQRRDRAAERHGTDQQAQPASVELLREEHRRLGEEIDRLQSQPDRDVRQRR